MDLLLDPGFWLALFSVTLVQIALGADNLIIITILANKLPLGQQKKAVRWGLILAMLFRIILLALVSWVLRFAGTPFYDLDASIAGIHFHGAISGKALVLAGGGFFLIWSGVKELRLKIKGVEHEVQEVSSFGQVLFTIVSLNLLFSVDSILTVVGMTDIFMVMMLSVVISVALMLIFAGPIAEFMHANPDFEILGLFVLLLIGFVLFLEGGHVAHLTVNDSAFPYIPQWITIFILLLMFSVDVYQNWIERKREQQPVELRRRKK
ncbi:MAG: TerC family protein [Thermoanaerobaculales bacterium]|jgi:predicted tellurium resistance membrane protein TerC|nr:TerC family protein [Thermoanaerobaculales bacterium]